MHTLKYEQFKEYGSWLICEVCGAAKHSGYWWHQGRRTELEPECVNPALVFQAMLINRADYTQKPPPE